MSRTAALGRWAALLGMGAVLLTANAVPAGASWAALGRRVLSPLHSADIVHHELEVGYDPAGPVLAVEDTLTLTATRDTGSVQFLLARSAEGLEAFWVGEGGAEPLAGAGPVVGLPAVGVSLYRVPLGRGLAVGESFRLRLRYRLVPDPEDAFDPFLAEGYVFLGQYPPWYAQAIREGFATFSMTVTAPPGFLAAGEGPQAPPAPEGGGETAARFASTVPVPTAALAIGPFRHRTLPAGGRELHLYASESSPLGRSSVVTWARRFAQALAWLEERLGPLSARSFQVVELPVWEPVTHSTLHTFAYGGDFPLWGWQSQPAQFLVAAHEAAHRWLGGTAGVTRLGAAWLAEGLPEYLGLLASGQVYGPAALWDLLDEVSLAGYLAEAEAGERPLGRIELFEPGGRLAIVKGAWLFRMFHGQVGDDAFWEVVRGLAEEGRGRHLTAADFYEVAAVVTGSRWEEFFDPWLSRPGALDLALAAARELPRPGGGVELRVRLRARGPQAWPAPLELLAETASGPRLLHLEPPLEERVHRFTLPAPLKGLELDPHHWVLDTDRSNNTWEPPPSSASGGDSLVLQ